MQKEKLSIFYIEQSSQFCFNKILDIFTKSSHQSTILVQNTIYIFIYSE